MGESANSSGAASSGWIIGTDVGGTFTDLWLSSPEGESLVCKSPTTADVYSGVINAVHLAADLVGMPTTELCSRVSRFGHGTTVGLNALLTARAAKVALITTAGFADVLEIGRLRRGTATLEGLDLGDYALRGRVPPLVPREQVYEVVGRIDSNGKIVTELDQSSLKEVINALVEEGYQAVAVCLLWATENPAHEIAVAKAVQQELPDAFVSMSHEIAPSVGEYARASTAAANAALGPIAGGYLDSLERELRGLGMNAPIMMTTNAGGVVPAVSLAAAPVNSLLSGPASCVVAGVALGSKLGRSNVLTMDVGGTSFDVGVIVNGVPLISDDVSFGGADMRVPSIDIASIGAGGGSIASVNGAVLTVGPRSAGAQPGPVCYGKGGVEPTTTDADLVLGILDPERFGSGGIVLDKARAAQVIGEKVGLPLGLSPIEAARAIRVVFDNNMADLLRSVTIERGHDPREFMLVAGGGSGPSHAWALCRELGLEGFVVPPTATAQSAFGAGTSDLRTTSTRTCYTRIATGAVPNESQVSLIQAAMTETGRRALETIPDASQAKLAYTAAVRFHGQAHHLDVSLEDAPSTDDLAGMLLRFESEYEALFGKGAGFREAGFEILSVRAVATQPANIKLFVTAGDKLERMSERPIVFDDPANPDLTVIYSCRNPAGGQLVEGPCLIELPGCVVVVPPRGRARTDDAGIIHVEVGQ